MTFPFYSQPFRNGQLGIERENKKTYQAIMHRLPCFRKAMLDKRTDNGWGKRFSIIPALQTIAGIIDIVEAKSRNSNHIKLT